MNRLIASLFISLLLVACADKKSKPVWVSEDALAPSSYPKAVVFRGQAETQAQAEELAKSHMADFINKSLYDYHKQHLIFDLKVSEQAPSVMPEYILIATELLLDRSIIYEHWQEGEQQYALAVLLKSDIVNVLRGEMTLLDEQVEQGLTNAHKNNRHWQKKIASLYGARQALLKREAVNAFFKEIGSVGISSPRDLNDMDDFLAQVINLRAFQSNADLVASVFKPVNKQMPKTMVMVDTQPKLNFCIAESGHSKRCQSVLDLDEKINRVLGDNLTTRARSTYRFFFLLND